VFPNGIDSVDGADLHDVAIGALKIKGKAFKAVDADSSGIIDGGVVARIRDIVGIGPIVLSREWFRTIPKPVLILPVTCTL